MRTLLLDGDIICYLSSIENEVAEEVEPGYWTWHCDFNKVQSSVENTLAYFLDVLEADDYIICLSDYKSSFRKQLYPQYKEQRSRNKKPLTLKVVREWLINEKGGLVYPSLEGDDVMGILATNNSISNPLIVSLDKDMKTIPCQLYKNHEEGVVTITESEADYWHLYQTLTGDTTDGYPGARGVGPVAAKKALGESPNWNTVLSLYKKAGFDEEFALTQARMARILRASDWDEETQTVKLWTPTN